MYQKLILKALILKSNYYLRHTLSVLQYDMPPIIIGLIFFIGPGAYAVSAPVYGWLADKLVSESFGMFVMINCLNGVRVKRNVNSFSLLLMYYDMIETINL